MQRPDAHGALVSPRPRFPSAVERSLLERRVRVLATAPDDVLDLGRPEARTLVLHAARGGPVERRHALVLSVAELVRFPDLVLALTGIERLVADDGQVVLIEPVHHPGLAATLFASCWSRHAALAQVHVERDVPAAARSTGFDLTDLERFTMSTAVWPLRSFVQVRARRAADRVVV